MTTTLGWAIVAATCLVGGGVYLVHHWAYKPAHAVPKTPGGGMTPRAAAGSAPGGESRRSPRGACAGKTGSRVLAPRPAAGSDDWDGDPAPRDWGRSHMPSAAERTAELAAIGVQLASPCQDCGIDHAGRCCTLCGFGYGTCDCVQNCGLTTCMTGPPWLAAPPPVVVEPAMLPLPEDERHPDYGWLYRDERQPQQRAEPDDYDIPLDREALETGTIIPGPGPDGWRELPGACRICDSEGHATTGHDQATAAQRQATAAETQAAGVIGAAMMLARLAAQPRPALPRLGSLDHLEQRLWTTDTGTLPAICGADDLGSA